MSLSGWSGTARGDSHNGELWGSNARRANMDADVSQPAQAAIASAPSTPLVTRSSVVAGNDLRLAAALKHHYQLVWRTLRGLGVWPANLDDAAQQVFLIFASKLEQLDHGRERAYLAQVAVRVAANARRAQQRRRRLGEEQYASRALTETDPESLLGAKQERQALQQILFAMPEEQRAVFILYELEGMTAAEIADALEIPQGTVASRLRRARKRFLAAAGAESPSKRGGLP